MKLLYTTLMVLTFSVTAFTQEFKVSADAVRIYETEIFKRPANVGTITSDGFLIHANDAFEVVDLSKGKAILKHDFTGGTGQTWIDMEGRYVGNYSQNVVLKDNRWSDAMQIYDIRAGKIYQKLLRDRYWNKGVFHPTKTQVLVNEYNSAEGGARFLLYDFVSEKEVKTYFTTTKFSTVIMAMAFSKDGSKIYAGIAPNGYTSYINVYDTESGEVLKKISFKYNLDKIFVSDDYVFCSGVDGDSGEPFTSKINASTYEVKTWDTFRMENMHPSGNFCYAVEYGSNTLSEYDLNTGNKKDLLDVTQLGNFDFAYTAGFSADGNFFYITRISHKGSSDGSIATLVFQNGNTEKPLTVETEEPPTLELEESETTFTYLNKEPKFSINLGGEPEVIEDETSSGGLKLTVKQSPSKNVVYMVMVSEMSPKIKKSKYTKTAEGMGEKFVEKLEAENPKKSTMMIDGQTATDYTFVKKGIFYRYVSVCIDGYAYQLMYLNSAGDGEVGADFYGSFTTR